MPGGLCRETACLCLEAEVLAPWPQPRKSWPPCPAGRTALTSGQNGGSSMFASSLLKFMSLNTGCRFTPAAPSPWQPRRCLGFLVRSCEEAEMESECSQDRKGTQQLSPVLTKGLGVAESTSI